MIWLLASLVVTPAAAQPSPPDYRQSESWAALGRASDSAARVPIGAHPRATRPAADIFYIHPTTYAGDSWNADLAEERRAGGPVEQLMVRQASAWNACCRVYAPYYRQAAAKAFAQRDSGGAAAYALAYDDVQRAFDHYLARYNRGRPFILVGHSQGALHLVHLLKARIAEHPVKRRLVAAYVIGFGISNGDFGTSFRTLTACRRPRQSGCVLAWSSFLEGADAHAYRARNEAKFRAIHPRGDATQLCINPLTFDADRPRADLRVNRGTLSDSTGLPYSLTAHAVGASCDSGILRVTPPDPTLGLRAIPGGGNMHYHDIALFYANIRANAVERVRAFVSERHR